MNDCAEVDRLLLNLSDYKNDYADMAAVKLLKKCSTSWDAYRYLLDRVHDVWLPDSAIAYVTDFSSSIAVVNNITVRRPHKPLLHDHRCELDNVLKVRF
jgi:hypothetical protein